MEGEAAMMGKPRGHGRYTVNRWVAAFMPFVMTGLAGYATWVLVVLISVKYLILSEHRIAAGAVIITLYFIFLLLFATAYLRVLWTISATPGFVPKGPDPEEGIKNEKIGDGSDSDPEIGLGSIRTELVSENFGIAGTLRLGTATTSTPNYRELSEPKDLVAVGSPDGPRTESPMPDMSPAFPSPAALPPSQKVSETPNSHTLLPPIIHHDRPPTGSTLQGRSYETLDTDPQSGGPEPENCMEFYGKDVFVCESNGRPKWCYHCNCYKPDRSHHCSEIARCVYKMDHFCPWVGGIVAEPSYKFFYQVVVYGTFYCLYLIVSLSYFIHEYNSKHNGAIDANWLAALGLSCLFGLFSVGMAGSTTQLIYRNLSTVDSLSNKTKVYQLAIHDPNPPQSPMPGTRVWLPANPTGGQQSRCFAIVNTKQGENPWRLDSTLDNFKEVLGYNIWDWWLPIKQSPLAKKGSGQVWYKLNETLLERLRSEAGIGADPSTTEGVWG